MLLTATTLAHIQNRRRLVALLAALCLLTRPDAIILLGPIALDHILQCLRVDGGKRRFILIARGPLRLVINELVVFLIAYFPWLLFATLYFGSPIPYSITAKTLAYRLTQESGLVRLLQHYATPFMENISLGVPAIMGGLVLYPFLFLVGARAIYKLNHRHWSWVIYPWLYFAVFALANPLIFRWYLTPPLPLYFLIILFGLDEIMQRLSSAGSVIASRAIRFPVTILRFLVVIALPFILLVLSWTPHPDHGLTRPAPQMAYYQLELLYRQAAEFLETELAGYSAPPTLAAGDVGVLGFFTRTRILDTVGLNSPQSTRYYPLDPSFYVINYAIPPDLIADERPDYVVILEVYGRNGLLIDPRFTKAYQLRKTIPTDIYGSQGLLIFQKSGNK